MNIYREKYNLILILLRLFYLIIFILIIIYFDDLNIKILFIAPCILYIIVLYYLLPGNIEISTDKLYINRFAKLINKSIKWSDIHLVENKDIYYRKHIWHFVLGILIIFLPKIKGKQMEILLKDGSIIKIKLMNYANSDILYETILNKIKKYPDYFA